MIKPRTGFSNGFIFMRPHRGLSSFLKKQILPGNTIISDMNIQNFFRIDMTDSFLAGSSRIFFGRITDTSFGA